MEPFWPLGTGCARGFLSCMDLMWMIKQHQSGKIILDLPIIYVGLEFLFKSLVSFTCHISNTCTTATHSLRKNRDRQNSCFNSKLFQVWNR